MGKNKLKKFAEMQQFECVFQYPFARLQAEGFPLKGRWSEHFGNNNPIVLELGCGKGEYTVGLARQDADINYIGIDIKGARIWTGAKQAETQQLKNAAFLRTDIELIDHFFEPGEVDGIWITFPDPQMQKTRRRLTSTRFMQLYRKILKPDGEIKLKTDSPFLYTYTRAMALHNTLPLLADTDNLYADTTDSSLDKVRSIKTFYEQQWLSRGKQIKFIAFCLPSQGTLEEIDDSEIERDDYHSYPRGIAQSMPGETDKQ